MPLLSPPSDLSNTPDDCCRVSLKYWNGMNYNIIGMSCCGGCSIRQVVRGAMRLYRPQSWHLGQAYMGFRFAYRNVHYGISSCWNKQLYRWLHAFGTNRPDTQLDCVSRSLMGWSGGPVQCESLVFSVITLDCAQTATIWLITLSCGWWYVLRPFLRCPNVLVGT